MNSLRLKFHPQFPLKIKRPPKVREAWLKDGCRAFRVYANGHRDLYRMKTAPVEEKVKREVFLVIDASPTPVIPLGEVWDALGVLCRIWFEVDGEVYESARMDGWKLKKSIRPPASTRPSDAAVDKSEVLALKLWGQA